MQLSEGGYGGILGVGIVNLGFQIFLPKIKAPKKSGAQS